MFGDSSKSEGFAIFTPNQEPCKKELPFTFKAFLASSKFKSNSALNAISISFEIASNSEFSEINFFT